MAQISLFTHWTRVHGVWWSEDADVTPPPRTRPTRSIFYATTSSYQLDLSFHAPGQKMPARQLRPVVAADRQRHSTLAHNLLQHASYSPAGKARIHFQGQTLPRVRIHHTQHPDRPPALHRIVHKIQRPLLVRRSPHQQRLPLAHAMLPLLPTNHQPCLPIHPMHALVVHLLARAAQQNMQSPIPEARFLPRQLH